MLIRLTFLTVQIETPYIIVNTIRLTFLTVQIEIPSIVNTFPMYLCIMLLFDNGVMSNSFVFNTLDVSSVTVDDLKQSMRYVSFTYYWWRRQGRWIGNADISKNMIFVKFLLIENWITEQ